MQERVLALTEAVEQLSADLGTSPTPQQLAQHLGIDTEAVLEAMVAASAHDTVSLDTPLRPHQESSEATIADGIGELDDGFDLAEHRSAIALALKALRPRERLILELRFADDLTQSEIAQRLGISQMHVSRLIRASLDRIRAEVGGG
jgi:RNA polymerase sigma-B factor